MTETQRPVVMIATHTHGTVTQAYAQSLAFLAARLTQWGISHAVQLVHDSLVERGRDRLAAAMLDGEFTHLLFIDADIEFRPEDVAALLAADKPLVAGAYLLKHWTDTLFAVGHDGPRTSWDIESATGAIKVDRVGTGFMLIRREVFEAIAAARPDIRYAHVDPDGEERELYAFFETEVREGRRVSEDFNFCDRWRATGGEVWILPQLRLGHWGPRCWRGAVADHMRRLPDAPEAAAE